MMINKKPPAACNNIVFAIHWTSISSLFKQAMVDFWVTAEGKCLKTKKFMDILLMMNTKQNRLFPLLSSAFLFFLLEMLIHNKTFI